MQLVLLLLLAAAVVALGVAWDPVLDLTRRAVQSFPNG
jgi:hypothetical protein